MAHALLAVGYHLMFVAIFITQNTNYIGRYSTCILCVQEYNHNVSDPYKASIYSTNFHKFKGNQSTHEAYAVTLGPKKREAHVVQIKK